MKRFPFAPRDAAHLAGMSTRRRRRSTTRVWPCLDLTERAFWEFCDDYLESARAGVTAIRSRGSRSENSALAAALVVYLRLLAPYPAV